MVRRHGFLIALAILILIGASLGLYFLSKGSNSPPLLLATAARRGIKLAVNTNGIIEPVERPDIYSPLDAIVKTIRIQEGSEVAKNQSLMDLDAQQVRTSLAEAKAALSEAERQARIVVAGPPKEEVSVLDASIAENSMQLSQLAKDLSIEESLYAKGATPREAVENLRKQRDTFQLRAENLKQRKEDLLARYSEQEKKWERDRVGELTKKVELLEQQLQMESILAPRDCLIYSLPVKAGSYVSRGQLLCQIFNPGKVRLRAYVDEPDLGRIKKGQKALIEWDGMPNRQWSGIVEEPAKQVVALSNRSVGYVLCSINGAPMELIPNLNVKVEITTEMKADALVVPRNAVFNDKGKPAVLLLEGARTITKPVELGLFTPEEIEIVRGIDAGSSIVMNHAEILAHGSH